MCPRSPAGGRPVFRGLLSIGSAASFDLALLADDGSNSSHEWRRRARPRQQAVQTTSFIGKNAKPPHSGGKHWWRRRPRRGAKMKSIPG
jgi:hypothetical protein